MRIQKTSKLIFFALAGLLLAGCSNIKYLPPGEKLYTGASVRVDPKETVRKKHIKGELEEIIRPKPNSSILGLRPKLWFYNIAGENSKKGIRKWLRTKIGEPPVLLSQVDPYLIQDLMKSKLDNMGYFKSRTKHELEQKKGKAEIEYIATVANPYKLNEITYPQGEDSLSTAIRNTQSKSLIYKGIQYDLNLLIDERARIDNELKNQGYYFFNPDFLVYNVDTSVGDRQINLLLGIKPDTPRKALNLYKLNKIYVIPQFSLTRKSRRLQRDTTYIEGYHFVERMSNYRHKALARYITLKEGDLYSKKNHDLTIRRLMGMGVFKFVSVKFNDTSYNNNSLLDARINLTQLLPRSLKVEVNVGAKSNNYTGPSITASYKNRNLWRGAELLQLSLNGAYEVQLSGQNKGFNSWEIGGGIQLVTPRFLTPFPIKHESSVNVPKTKFDFEYRALHRVQYFDMNGINFTFGYIWRESERKQYEVNPIAVNFSKLRNTTPEFDAILEKNQYLRRSFEEQFTFGSTASFTYNTLTGIMKRDQYYYNIMLDLSGNTASLVNRIATGEKSTDEKPYKIFRSRFSQYVKLSNDFRYYSNFDKNNKLASRIIIGSGIPYGNSEVMPYSKQFFSGGANSVRAFLPRSLGPGSYRIDEEADSGFFDQSGDIKLELNLEFRFGIISVLKGAVFTDAGNVWLMRSNESLPGGEFRGNRFMKEIAVGTGFGLRVDLSFFLIRLDLGIPVRKPWLPEKDRWVFDQISFGNREWRRDNLVYNIAIGYPF